MREKKIGSYLVAVNPFASCSAFRSPGSHTTSKIPQWFLLRHNPKPFLARVFRDAMSMADRDRRDKERGRLRRRRSKERDKERGGRKRKDDEWEDDWS